MSKAGLMPELGVYKVDECFVGPSGILFSLDRKIIVAPDLTGQYFRDVMNAALMKADGDNLRVKAYNGDLPVVDLDSDFTYVALGTTGYGVYGHWLLDILPRTWCFLKYAELTALDLRSVKFLLPATTPQWAFVMLKDGLNIESDQIMKLDDAQMTRVKQLFVPSLLRVEDLMSPALNDFVSLLTERSRRIAVMKEMPNRIYISRHNVKSYMDRVTGNEVALEAIAARRGLTLINPASLPWLEQIQLFTQAKLVVGPFGSGIHNTIFSPSSTVSLVLAAAHMNWFQTCISALRKQSMGYIFPVREELVNGKLLLEYDEEAFASGLDDLCRLCK